MHRWGGWGVARRAVESGQAEACATAGKMWPLPSVGQASACPFESVDAFQRKTRLRDDQLTKLAYAGALGSLGLTRRAALWQAARVAKPAGELFDGGVIRSREDGEEPPAHMTSSHHRRESLAALGISNPLPEMSRLENTDRK